MTEKTHPEVAPTSAADQYDETELSTIYDDFPGIRDVDPDAVARRMSDRVMRAQSLDELFDSLSGSTSDALVGKSFRLFGVAWQPFETEKGVIPNAIVEAADIRTGESREFATTARMLVAFLRRAKVLNPFPFDVRIVEKLTRSGQKALNFERV